MSQRTLVIQKLEEIKEIEEILIMEQKKNLWKNLDAQLHLDQTRPKYALMKLLGVELIQLTIGLCLHFLKETMRDVTILVLISQSQQNTKAHMRKLLDTPDYS